MKLKGFRINVKTNRVEEVFEARTPKGEAIFAVSDGEVIEVNDKSVKIKYIKKRINLACCVLSKITKTKMKKRRVNKMILS